MAESDSESELPVLAIVLDTPTREFFPLTYVEAAAGVCRPLWVMLRRDADTARYGRILRRSGHIIDVAELSPDSAARAIAELAPVGIIAFNEANVPWTAEVAEILGLPYHSRRTASQLADKLQQRIALHEYGLVSPRFWDLDALRTEAARLTEVEASARFPLVLKPRVGRSSRDMARVETIAQLRTVATRSWPEPMMIEEFIPDPSAPRTGPGNANYVSVEVLVSQGVVSALGATGRHPLVEPFREAGLFFPAEVSQELYQELVETASAAVSALDIKFGALHVELKVTDAGPVVIEINPRPGGSALPDLLRHALGIDIFQVTMRIALGELVVYRELPAPADVGFSVYVLPPAGVRHITSVEGIETISGIEGVESVVPKRGTGDDIDPHEGMLEYIVRVSGTVPNHDARRQIRERILSQVVVTGTT
ncbi:ATP-grasp domain-containing protein [Humibacter sp.]|uniref:ATP-grasp domain-containing protein n=1 Tax=Humibacter sp. TaxID=1940291 RepID=UPI003F7DCB98